GGAPRRRVGAAGDRRTGGGARIWGAGTPVPNLETLAHLRPPRLLTPGMGSRRGPRPRVEQIDQQVGGGPHVLASLLTAGTPTRHSIPLIRRLHERSEQRGRGRRQGSARLERRTRDRGAAAAYATPQKRQP